MPTGYTAGIVDGKITTFPQFAKLCMRAMGATIHMRDEDMNIEYKQRIPSDFYKKEMEKAKDIIRNASILSDEQIMHEKLQELEESRTYHLNSIEKTKVISDQLLKILYQVRQWTPPTPEHAGLKDFMVNQLVETIKFDGDSTYHEEALAKSEGPLDVKVLRAAMLAKGQEDLAKYTEEYRKEVERCNNSNKWVEQLIASVDQNNFKAMTTNQ